ncbi:MAG: tetratricopeptide repeat protein [bacterium]
MSNVAKLKKQAAEFELKKQFDKALAVYVKLLDDFDEHADELDVALFNRVGDLMLRQGNVADAVDYYERAVDRYADTGFFNNAIALCSKILRHSPGRAIIHYKLGKISAQKGFKNDAKVNFLEYADRMQKAGKVDEAFRALKEFADLCPDQDEIRLMLADQLTKADRKPEAIEQLQTLHERYDGEGRSREAAATAERIRAINPAVEPRSAGGGRRKSSSGDLIFLDLDEPPRQSTPPSSYAPPVRRAETPPSGVPPTPARPSPAVAEEGISSPATPTTVDGMLTGITRIGDDVLAFEQTPSQSLLGIEPTSYADLDVPPISQPDRDAPPERLAGLEPTSLVRPIEAVPRFTPPTQATPPNADSDDAAYGGDLELIIPEAEPTPARGEPSLDFDLSSLTTPTTPPPPTRPTPNTTRIALEGLPLMDLEVPAAELPPPRLSTPLGSPAFPSDLELVDPPDDETTPEHSEEISVSEWGEAPVASEPAPSENVYGEADALPAEAVHEATTGAQDDTANAEADAGEALEDASVDDATSSTASDAAGEVAHDVIEDVGDAAVNELGEESVGEATDVFAGTESVGEEVRDAQSDDVSSDEIVGEVADEVADDVADDLADETEITDLDDEPFVMPTPSVSRRSTMVAAHSVELLKASVDGDPENWGLRRQMAEAMLEAGDRDGGIRELESAMAGADRAGDLGLASSLAEEVARIEPEIVRHHQKRVEYAFRTNDRSRLIEAYLSLADALLRSDQADKSRTVYQRVLDLAPDEARARAALDTIVVAEPEPPPPAPPPRASTQKRPSIVRPAVDAPPPAASASESFVNLGDWLRDTEGPKDTRMVVAEQEPTGDEAADFADMLRKFKQGVAENVDAEDYQSHYDLAIAFKEMGLLDEAISEFQKALGGANKVPTYEALGQCFIDKGQFKLAMSILGRALNEKASEDQLVGVLYLLGRAAESLGQADDALNYYQRVFVLDIQFRDVADRISDVERAAR